MREVKFKELKKEYQNLLNKAEKVLKNSYDPYSNLLVGAALLTKNNKIITGANVNGSVSGICAERAAIFRANTMGERHFKALAVISNFEKDKPIVPCGFCRQIIYDFFQISGIDLEIIMSSTDKEKISIAKISELLPLAFTL